VTGIMPILAIATNTFREAIRNRILYTLLFFAVLLIASGILLGSLSFVDSDRIFQSVGLAAIRIFGTAIAIFVGIGLIYKEIERRTIFTILSKPISRGSFLIGKYVGLVATVWLQVLLMGLAFAVVSLSIGAPFGQAHLAQFGLLLGELALVLAIATLFCSFSTPILSCLFATGLVVVGHLTRDLRVIGADSQLESVKQVTALAYRVLPDLEGFDLSLVALHGLSFEMAQVWVPLLYGACYSATLLLLAVCIIDRRDFS